VSRKYLSSTSIHTLIVREKKMGMHPLVVQFIYYGQNKADCPDDKCEAMPSSQEVPECTRRRCVRGRYHRRRIANSERPHC